VALITTLLVSVLASTAASADIAAVEGLWADDRTILRIEVMDDRLSAVVVALKDPLYLKDEGVGIAGEVRRDLNNPDADKRDRLMMGMDLLSAYQYVDGRWEGDIYDPESGKVYSSFMTLSRGRLKMRGYIGVALLGRTAYFEAVEKCSDHIVEMLQLAGITGHCENT